MPYPRQATWFLLPLAFAVLFLAVYGLAGEARGAVVSTSVALAKCFALAGFVLGASRFSWGDRMHTVWFLLAINMTLLLGKDLFFGYALPGAPVDPSLEWQRTVRGVIVVIANIPSIYATVLLARTWREAGLEIAPSKRRQLAKLAVVPFAVLLFVVGLRANIAKLPTDPVNTVVLLLVPFGDLLCFSLIGPLAVTAFSLRGGSLATPWAMFACGAGIWLVWDMETSLSHLSGVTIEVSRILALTYTGTAGLAQWRILHRPRGHRAQPGTLIR